MKHAIFDLESDGLYFDATQVHSLCIGEEGTDFLLSCTEHTYQPLYPTTIATDVNEKWGIVEGLKVLEDADLIIGHNIVNFDLPTLQKLYPDFKYDINKVRDTLLLSRLIYPNLADRDIGLIKKGVLPPRLRGSHSLKAWGYRLGIYKGEFGQETDWKTWSPEMQAYCEQDVEVTKALWEKLKGIEVDERAVELEHWFAYIIAKQEKFGFRFNLDKAVELYVELGQKRESMDDELKSLFNPWYVKAGSITPKRDNKTSGYIAGAPLTKVKLQEFNPSSRQQIADRLQTLYHWKPKEFTPSGTPKIDETVLSKLPYPAAKHLAKRFLLEKRIGQLAEGQNAWLKLERNGRIHGSVNTIGAVTGRCTHSSPNVAQVPAVRALYGDRCRELFHVDEGFVQLGADASGLELRCLAHYMAKYDGGAYAKLLLEDDIHTVNQRAAGLPTRDNAKTFIYAFLYGAGDAKIGSIVGKGAKAGRKLKNSFLNKTPALKRLREDVEAVFKKRGHLRGIDGRILHIRSAHSALNTLLQSAGALLVKQATINLYKRMERLGFVWGKDWAMVAHVHDEFQLQVRKDIAEEVSLVAVEAFREAGKQFNWRCPLDGEAKIGLNWAECH